MAANFTPKSVVQTDYDTTKGILQFPDGYEGFAQTFDKTANAALVKTVDGRSVIPAGTIFPANDGTAKGVVFYAVDVTNASATGTVLYRGTFNVGRLPEVPSAAAISALTECKFFNKDGTGLMVPGTTA